MFKRALLALALLASPAAGFDGGRFGEVEVIAPQEAPRGLVLLFSDAGALTRVDKARLAAIAAQGAIAVGVDSQTYLKALGEAKPGCVALFFDVEDLSRDLQRRYPGPLYRVPIVAGEGIGGELASRIVIQSPLQRVAAGVAVDPASPLPLARDLCPRPLEADDKAGPDALAPKLPWRVALTPAASAATRARFAALAGKLKMLSLRELPAEPDAKAFAGLIAPFLAPAVAPTVDGLPLVELRASRPTRRLAIFLSGDGGWRDVDKRVSEKLQSLGVSVVGWDSLHYFWRRKTPEQGASDLAAVIAAYGAKWGCDEVALIGFSFGADVTPFIYDKLDPALRERIAMISLLSPGVAADWEIQVAGWLGAGPSSRATPLAPALADFANSRTQCFYGDKDKGNSCALFGARGAELIEKPGNHHMDGAYDSIAQHIFDGFVRRTPGG